MSSTTEKPFPFVKPKGPPPKVRKEFKGCVSVRDALRIGFDEMLYADFVIACSDGKLPVHLTLLAAVSPFIRSVLEDTPDAVVFIVPDIKMETMKQILSILYTGQACSPLIEDFEEVKEGLALFGLEIDPESWSIENAILEPLEAPEVTPKTATAPASKDSTDQDDNDSGDEVKIIDPVPNSNLTKSDGAPTAAKKRKLTAKNKAAIKRLSEVPAPAQFQNLVNILPKSFTLPVPVQMPQMFVAPSTNDVIQAMIQSRQLTLGPGFSNGAQYYQQTPSAPTYVTGIQAGTAPTYVNQGLMPMPMPMQLGFYPQQQGQQMQGSPILQGQRMQGSPILQGQRIQGSTIHQQYTVPQLQQNQVRPPPSVFYQNGAQSLPAGAKVIRIPMSGHSPGQGQGHGVMNARMTKSPAAQVTNSEMSGPYGILPEGAPERDPEPEDGVVYVIDENFYQSGDDNFSPTSDQSGEADGEEIEIIGWNVDDQENNEFQMTEEEIMSNAVVSSKKDHAYAFFAPKETKRGRKMKLQAKEMEIEIRSQQKLD